MNPHYFHNHEWMDHHFKMHSVWCDGICTWCYLDMTQAEIEAAGEDEVFGGLHGDGAHK
jgi:hypothetical protein